MRKDVKVFAILFGCCIGFHASATEIFRCTTSSGAVEYKDFPCSPGTGGKVVIPDDTPSPADQAAANKSMREMREQLAIDARMNARAKAVRDARDAEAREEARRISELYAQSPPAEPQVVLLPVAVDPCVVRPKLCTRRHHHEHRDSVRVAPTVRTLSTMVAQRKK